ALQTGLNFVNDAEVADELRAARIDEVRLAIGAAINVYRREISGTRFFPAKSSERSEHQEHRAHRNAAVSKALRVEGAEPREDCFPAGDWFARAQSLVQNVVNEARRRFDLRKRMQAGQRLCHAGDKRSAARTRVHVGVELFLLSGR